MQKLKKYFLFLLIIASYGAKSQNPAVIQTYIETYKDIAMDEMKRTGVPAAITIAQGIHETSAGTSILVLKSNNHFGIKCKDTWTGSSVTHDDDLRGECFRKYNSSADSYRDHSDFLRGSQRYAFLFTLESTDYVGWAKGLKKAGYATNPKYSDVLIKLIEDYHLQDYTLIAMGKKTMPEENFVRAEVIATKNETVQGPIIEVSSTQGIKDGVSPLPKIDKPDFPEGEFKINETRVVWVPRGTAYLGVAQQYNVPLARIFEFNDLHEHEMTENGEYIYLQRKRKTGAHEFHTVKPGETLHDIAQEESIRLETLLEYNWLKTGQQPAIGEQLFLRSKATALPKLAVKENYSLFPSGTPATSAYLTYTVQPKETIYSISKKYNVKTDDLIKWNQLEGPDLKTGQSIKIFK
ncbi:MAG TPA: glucosaminidase domain-containing protein [Chitinophagaceae bacterium]|nr:glucosaminidase domain-containing protein [Chitinophagaceae bacterium]